jgi:hypothetical protein
MLTEIVVNCGNHTGTSDDDDDSTAGQAPSSTPGNIEFPICETDCDDEAVLCAVCNRWLHYSCQNLSKTDIARVEKTDYGEYTCKPCQLSEAQLNTLTQQNDNHPTTPATTSILLSDHTPAIKAMDCLTNHTTTTNTLTNSTASAKTSNPSLQICIADPNSSK